MLHLKISPTFSQKLQNWIIVNFMKIGGTLQPMNNLIENGINLCISFYIDMCTLS